MDTSTGAQRAYSDQIISRLRRQYVEQRIVPGTQDEPLNFQLLRKLCQHVLAEGYGESSQHNADA